jgi:hypothetical protein
MTEDELKRIIPCRCDEAYTSRGLKAPDCPWHNYGDEVMEIINRLLEEIDTRNYASGEALDRVFKAVLPRYPPWEYPMQAAREIIDEFERLQTELEVSRQWAARWKGIAKWFRKAYRGDFLVYKGKGPIKIVVEEIV